MVSYKSVIGLLVLGVALGNGCGSVLPSEVGASDVHDMDLGGSAATMTVGATRDFTPTFSDDHGAAITGIYPEIVWTTTNPAVATVTAAGAHYDGRVTAVGPGTAVIRATCCDGVNVGVTITVPPPTCLRLRPAMTAIAMARAQGCGTTWVLDSTSGASSGNWTDAGATLNGAVVFSPPAEVVEGGTYAVTSTFNATLTSNGSGALDWAINAQLTDVTTNAGAAAFAQANKFINANPTVSGSVSATGNWTIPASYDSQLTLKLKATGYGAIGTFLNRTAYYHKVQ